MNNGTLGNTALLIICGSFVLQGCTAGMTMKLMDGFPSCPPTAVQENMGLHRSINNIPDGASSRQVIGFMGVPQERYRYDFTRQPPVSAWIYKAGNERCMNPNGLTAPVFFMEDRVIGVGWDYFYAAIEPSLIAEKGR